MPTYSLTLIDVRRVQTYIFGANKLKQNLGASELVEQATHEWIAEHLPAPHNLARPDLRDFSDSRIDAHGLSAEVLYTGGGNAAVLFANRDLALTFARQYTLTVMLRAPGLEVAVAHTDVSWGQEPLAAAWQRLQTELMPRRKEGRVTAQAVPGLAVTGVCAYTGAPAVAEQGGVLVGTEVLAKLAAEADASERLTARFQPRGFRFPREFEDLAGEKGRFDYIAVVHADGNGMGRRIKEYLDAARDDRDLITRLRAMSRSINDLGQSAMRAVYELLLERLDESSQVIVGADERDELTLSGGHLPIRPIVLGGDDVTFVCNGRLGLALAAKFLRAFEAAPLADGRPAQACAGVAIVHSHYPFAQAYALAADLCQAAKREVRQTGQAASLVHWHFATTGLLSGWSEIARREYQAGDRSLTMRPVRLTGGDWRTWETLTQLVDEFRGEQWAGRRNKVKDLRVALRAGPAAVESFTRLYDPLPWVGAIGAGAEAAAREGWHAGRCVYFDAVEAMDFLMKLE